MQNSKQKDLSVLFCSTLWDVRELWNNFWFLGISSEMFSLFIHRWVQPRNLSLEIWTQNTLLSLSYHDQASLLKMLTDMKSVPPLCSNSNIVHHTVHIFCRSYSRCTMSEGHSATQRKTKQQFTDLRGLLCVRTQMKLFRHSETNMFKCDSYPWHSSCL